VSGRTDLYLDYWAKGNNGYTFYLYLSRDGDTWSEIWSGVPPTSYTRYTLDLDELCVANGVAVDADVYVRWVWQSRYGYDAYLDDVKIAVIDSDNDGLSDSDEDAVWSTDPNNVDSDGDGVTDGTEALLEGINPADPSSFRRLVPRVINYQGRLKDSGGSPVNGTVDMTFGLYGTPTGGTALWTEAHSVDVSGGIFNVLLGGLEEIPKSVFVAGDAFLAITVEGEDLLPKRQVLSQGMSMNAMLVAGKRLDVGTKTISVRSSSVVTVPVVFSRRFSIPPRVAFSASSMRVGSQLFVVQKITDISATGFTVVLQSVNGALSSGEASFTWFAHGE